MHVGRKESRSIKEVQAIRKKFAKSQEQSKQNESWQIWNSARHHWIPVACMQVCIYYDRKK